MMTKEWTVELKPKALKDLKKLDKKLTNKIFNFLDSLAEDFESPRSVGKALKGGHRGLWCYRVGDYRLICQLQDNVLLVVVAQIGHRKDIYDTH